MQAVILAAGRGKRLAPVSRYHTKAMAPVAGKPMVQRVMDLFTAQGIRDFVLVIGPDDDEIRRHFSGYDTDAGLVRLVDQHDRLGTAHALRMAASLIEGDFVLSACDNLVPDDHIAALIEVHRARAAMATLSLKPVHPDAVASTGIVAWDGSQVTRIVEKPAPKAAPSNVSSLPLYVFGVEFLENLANVQPSSRGEYELQDAIQAVIDDGHLVTGVLTPWRRQLTTVDDLLALNHHFLAASPARCVVHGTARLGLDIVLSAPQVLDSHVCIEDRAMVGPSVYCAPGAHIGRAAIVRHALLLTGATVPAHARVDRAVVLPNGDVVPAPTVEQMLSQ